MPEQRIVLVHGQPPALTQRIEIGRHRLTADEPAPQGGNDEGPTPYDLLLAALGTCKAMTVTLYAERKAWRLDSVTVRLSHRKVHAEDCRDCEDKDVRLDRIDCELQFSGSLDAEQRARLLEIANRCPVHRTLTSKIDIRSSLAAP
jgi:putative redox protein